MQETMICGTGSFKDVDKDLSAAGGGGVEAPTAATLEPDKVKKTKKKSGKKENPYASRGLDKFSTVVAELESRRERILRRVAPAADGADRVMVRFVQSDGAQGWVPVVVKLPPEEQAAADAKGNSKKPCKKLAAAVAPASKPSTPGTSEPSSPREEDANARPAAAAAVKAPAPAKRIKATAAAVAVEGWSWGKKVRPHHYMPLVAVLLLLSLVAFGRVFAICCASVWWYLVPILAGSDAGDEAQQHTVTTRAMGVIGKDLGRKSSDKKIGEKLAVAPLLPSHGKKSSSGAHDVISPRSHGGHRKKG